MSVIKMFLLCSFTLRSFKSVLISVSRTRRASHCGLEKMISTEEILLMKEGVELLLQVAHVGPHGSMTQPVDLKK